jgi:hypothetical protein
MGCSLQLGGFIFYVYIKTKIAFAVDVQKIADTTSFFPAIFQHHPINLINPESIPGLVLPWARL